MAGKIEEEIDINIIAGFLARTIYHVQLDALNGTLDRFHTPKTRYSILDDRDDTYCIEYENGEWITFTSERGQKTSLLSFDNVDDACKKVMFYMSGSREEYEQMVFYFDNLVKEKGGSRFTSRDIYTAIENGVAQTVPKAIRI